MSATCSNCGGENSPDGRFCIFCGSRLLAEAGSEPEDQPPEDVGEVPAQPDDTGAIDDRVRSLHASVKGIREDLFRLSGRLSDTERQLRALSPTSPSRQHPTSAAVTTSASPLGASGVGAPPRPPRIRILDSMSGWDWEWLVGGNWLARIGIVALTIGIGFFLKLSFDNNWIGETGRVALGITFGLALLGGGELWQKRYPIWAQPLTGGGIAVLYLSIFAAFSLYDLIDNVTAFGLFFLITLAAAGLALKYDAMAIAILGIIGGFVTPILLKDNLPDQRLLIAYILVLDLGVLAMATFRNWRWFTLLGLAGSLFIYQFWYFELDPSLHLAEIGITFIFLIFVGATNLFHILWRRVPGPADLALILLNAAAYFGISYGLLFDEYRSWMGGFTLLLSLLYGLIGYGVLARSKEQVYLSLFSLGIAVVFLTIAVPVQLGGPWISVAWAVEGAVLIYLSFTLKMRQLRWFGLAVFGAFAAYLLFIDTPDALRADIRPFLNIYTPAYLLVIATTFLLAYLMYREKESLARWEIYLFPIFLVAGNLFLTVAMPTQADGAWIAVTWAVQASVLMGLSFRLGLIELRLISLGVFAIVVVRLLAFDTRNVDLETFRPIYNLRFLAFAVGITAMYLAAYMLWRWKERVVDEREKNLILVFVGIANILTLWILSAEVIASVDSKLFDVGRDIARDVTSLSLSVLWAIYAATGIVLGIVTRTRLLRIGGLALLSLPVLKLFILDIFELQLGYRVVAFIGLGGLLVVGGYLYQRYTRVIRGFLLE